MGLSNPNYVRNAKNPHIAGKIAKPPPLGEENRKKNESKLLNNIINSLCYTRNRDLKIQSLEYVRSYKTEK